MRNQKPETRNQRKDFRSLIMWHKSNELVINVYKRTAKFPKEEIYGFTSQIRRAALSVVLNIVEGYGRNSKGDFGRFLDIAYASLSEVEYLLELSVTLRYLDKTEYNKLESLRTDCAKMIWSYRSKLKN